MIPLQHIIFEPYLPNECACNDATFRLLAKRTDTFQFQVKVAPCAGAENVICNPTFSASEFTCSNWIAEGGFALNDGACCEDATGTLTQFESLVTGNIYQCEILIESITGTLFIYNGLTEVAQITTIGTTVFTFIAVAQSISMEIQDTDHAVCIDTFSARPLSNEIAFGVINSNGGTLNVYDVFNSPDFFTFVKDTMTVKFGWSDFDVQEGQCYTIGYADGCTNTNAQFGIFNQGFDNCLSGWIINAGTIPSIECEVLENPETGDAENMIEFSNTGTGTITPFQSNLKVGLFYIITIDAMSTDADGFLRIYTGTTFYDFTVSGEQNVQLCTDTQIFKIEAHLQTSTYIRLWGFNLRIANILDFEFDYETTAFKIGENECTHVIGLSNDDDNLGLVFVGANFGPELRLESVIKNSVAEFIRETYHDNLGTKRVYYGEYRKHFILHIDYVPAWVVDFINMCFIADHFFIDGVEYFIEGESPEIIYPEGVCFNNMAAVKMEVSIKTQMIRNSDLGNASNPVTFGVTQALVDNNGNEIIELFTGQAIDVPL